MNMNWQSMTGFGAMAWNHGGPPLIVPATRHHPEQKTGSRVVLESGESAHGKGIFTSHHVAHSASKKRMYK